MKFQSNTHSLVINYPNNNLNYDLDKLVIDVFKDFEYFYIIHDKDIDENGNLKTRHMHLILLSENRISTDLLINMLCMTSKGIINDNLISDKYVGNLAKAMQYLTHKNDRSKTLYSTDEVVSNNYDKFYNYYNALDLESLSTDSLIELMDNCRSKKELLLTIGISQFNKYANFIKFYWKDK